MQSTIYRPQSQWIASPLNTILRTFVWVDQVLC